MGNGFWILVWDGFGSGLNLINPRLHTDSRGNNWFVCNNRNQQEVIDSLNLNEKYGSHWTVVK